MPQTAEGVSSKKASMVEEKVPQERPANPWIGPRILAGGLYHDGSLAANRLGLQLARVATLQANWRRRNRPVDPDLKPHVEAFERDGVLALEGFLPEEVFASLQTECRAAWADGLFEPEVKDDGVTEGNLPIKRHRDRMPVTWAALAENDFLKRLAAALVRRPNVEKMNIEARFTTESKDAPRPSRLAGVNYLHADVHFPSAKAWLYVNDIDEQNGAFVYAKGSQKMTLARLKYEYDASVRVAKANRDGTIYSEVAGNVVMLPTEKQQRAMGISETVMSGKANTLVFADISGFHRRGEFASGARREQIQIRFYDRPPTKDKDRGRA
jgi:hypothetical protein